MKIVSNSPEDYLSKISPERLPAMIKLRETIRENLPEGFEETIQYDMISYVVPKTVYPNGYHVNPELPLPFISIASQKNFIAVYHMGIYSYAELLEWFKAEFPKYSKRKLDMGKSCIRFKKIEEIPYKLLGELAKKITVRDWIKFYELSLERAK